MSTLVHLIDRLTKMASLDITNNMLSMIGGARGRYGWGVYLYLQPHGCCNYEGELKKNALVFTPRHFSFVLHPNAQGP
jgi:hypothetical protein